MHAPLSSREVGQVANGFGRAHHKGVEQTYFDLGVLVQSRQDGVHSTGAAIVQKQAYTHVAVGCVQQLVEQKVARGVVAPDVVLNVQCAFRCAGQQGASGIGIMGIRQHMNATFSGMLLLQRLQGLSHSGLQSLFAAQGLR